MVKSDVSWLSSGTCKKTDDVNMRSVLFFLLKIFLVNKLYNHKITCLDNIQLKGKLLYTQLKVNKGCYE
jgi:hypothetical protein